jgi:hypothetical protein
MSEKLEPKRAGVFTPFFFALDCRLKLTAYDPKGMQIGVLKGVPDSKQSHT